MRLRSFQFIGVLVAGLLIAACNGTSDRITSPTAEGPSDVPSSQQPPPATSRCDATRAEWAIGQTASEALLERARVAAGAATARFLLPDQPITMEFLATRLNLGLDASNVVRNLNCG